MFLNLILNVSKIGNHFLFVGFVCVSFFFLCFFPLWFKLSILYDLVLSTLLAYQLYLEIFYDFFVVSNIHFKLMH